jgi:hypothetical protein
MSSIDKRMNFNQYNGKLALEQNGFSERVDFEGNKPSRTPIAV